MIDYKTKQDRVPQKRSDRGQAVVMLLVLMAVWILLY